jgi:hydrogenase expression/formation protein HypE
MNIKEFCIKAVLFDFDGTLTRPGTLDFHLMQEAIDCPLNVPMLEFIESITDPTERSKSLKKLNEFEFTGAKLSKPNKGAEEIVRYLRSKGVYTGIITRNSMSSIKLALKNFKNISADDFDVIVSRDSPVKTKPAPDGILLAAKRLNIDAEQIMIVGDYMFDIQAGQRAKAVTVLIDNNTDYKIEEADYTFSDLKKLKNLIRMFIPLGPGKLPNDLLEEFLGAFAFKDKSILIKPEPGEDCAAVDIDNEEVLVLTSDPITFTTDKIGHYSVLVNANDIATSGAVPRWMLTSLLVPVGITPLQIQKIIDELKDVCEKWNITLCGGHTEVTDAVTRPVVTGMMAGTVSRNELIDKKGMRTGHKVLMTKSAAVEGSAIIAKEFETRLKKAGISQNEIERCQNFIHDISILNEAKIAANISGVSAMHDVTEGGIATAIKELSIAGAHKVRINIDQIPVFPETEKICGQLKINPLGLIGSGSLLICCKQDTYKELMNKIKKTGINITCIGEVVEKGAGVEAFDKGKQIEWPCFEVDEIAGLDILHFSVDTFTE